MSEQSKLDQFKSLADVAFKSGNYSGFSREQLINLMMVGDEMGIGPFKAIGGSLMVIQGKVCMSTSLMSDCIRNKGHSIKIPEWTSEKCVIIGVRKDNNDSIKFEYTIEDAKIAGLLNSPTWKRFPKNMLYNRAMSTLARVLFPDVLGNVYSEDEKWDIMGVPPQKREENPKPEEIQFDEPEEKLFDELMRNEISIDNFQEIINELAEKKSISIKEYCNRVLQPHLLVDFLDFFKNKSKALKVED